MRIWVVDDKIPLEHLYPGPYPTRLDAALVRELIEAHEGEWEEQPVLELCRAVCDEAHDSIFFKAPDGMLVAMDDGIRPPHVVIFDWEYPGSTAERNLATLRRV